MPIKSDEMLAEIQLRLSMQDGEPPSGWHRCAEPGTIERISPDGSKRVRIVQVIVQDHARLDHADTGRPTGWRLVSTVRNNSLITALREANTWLGVAGDADPPRTHNPLLDALCAALLEVYRILAEDEPADDALDALGEYTADEARHVKRLLAEARAEAARNADAAGYWRMIADVVHEVDAAHRGAGRMADDDAAPLVLRALRQFPKLVKERDAARAEAEELAGLLGEAVTNDEGGTR